VSSDLQQIGLKSKYNIDPETRKEDGFVWRFTGIYGESNQMRRRRHGICFGLLSIKTLGHGYAL
jgi:hypothetical protein